MIKVITKDQAVEPKPFPKLMKHRDGTIGFFKQEGVGMYIYSKKEFEIGHHSTLINMNEFTDYEEPITIQNV